MSLSDQQKTAIRTYFESNYNMFFGIPSERKEGDLTPNEHVMLLQYMQLILLNLPVEPLDSGLLNKIIKNDYDDETTVSLLLNDFLEGKLSPIKPDSYLIYQKNFQDFGNKEDLATAQDILKYLVTVTETIAAQIDHGYLKTESDPRRTNSNSNVSRIIKWGIFGGAALGMTYALSKLCDSSSSSNALGNS
ncbi:hypothetical protein EP47_04380 [Legionella norrlandica]|uniref:Uncharacterized protein n=1 Tax=Legionella norrlandica TaxID=1498499 RepID=A0A0A2SR27_9GAMM|nr:hypothetical protein [Legionella norrlandica]KGP63207.1 hypothetical protein EP47_04380 [Legionella norrlandica]